MSSALVVIDQRVVGWLVSSNPNSGVFIGLVVHGSVGVVFACDCMVRLMMNRNQVLAAG